MARGWLGFGTCALPRAARGTEPGRAGGMVGQLGERWFHHVAF